MTEYSPEWWAEYHKSVAKMTNAQKDFYALTEQLPQELKDKMRELHDEFYCAAKSEGQWCCIDYLTGDAKPDEDRA